MYIMRVKVKGTSLHPHIDEYAIGARTVTIGAFNTLDITCTPHVPSVKTASNVN